MSQDYLYTLIAKRRDDQGKGASRRLRREGWVPAIVYGGNEEPLAISVKQDDLVKYGKIDSFYSQIINLQVEGMEDAEVLVRDVQRHLYKPLYQHMDFQRIVRGQEIHATVTLHFINEDTAPGVKAGGMINHHINSLDIVCRPRHLPEYIEVDMGQAEVGDVIHIGDIKLPEGVRLAGDVETIEKEAAAQIIMPKRAVDIEDEDGEAAAADDAAE
ncbi:MAG: 50S ribosomal protein L25/general stress protein Ctc [Cardiobacteriaceae bacterium]|nr:50S ribosomal protein L25/general stress protein Ctc [Cardiobacteriaceae bacterium]